MTTKKSFVKKAYRKPKVTKKEQSHVCSGACGLEPARCGKLVIYYT